MRTIEYRGLYKGKAAAFWLYGDLLVEDRAGKAFIRNKYQFKIDANSTTIKPIKAKRIKDPTIAFIEVDPNTVGLYTGKKDTKGQKAYEGDLLEDWEKTKVFTIRWGKSGFEVLDITNGTTHKLEELDFRRVEITGSVHDWLKEKKEEPK